tara:strand:+ start:759 stop:920 length:162 start_codon:yes stop_codon:yes gene_type:complete
MATPIERNGTEIVYENVIIDLLSETLNSIRELNSNLNRVATSLEDSKSTKGGK